MKDDRLAGTVAIVTGAGRGIGKATAIELAGRGAAVAVCARTTAELTETAAALEAAGARHLATSLDVTDAAAMSGFAADVASTLGPPGLLVNNAAMLGPVGPLLEADLRHWQRTLEVNVGGIAVACQAIVPHMTSPASVINLSGGGIGGPGLPENVSAYTASKAAVVALTEVLSKELASLDISVNAVAPGAVATRFTEPVLEAGPERAGALFEATQRQRAQSSSLESFFELVVYLASSAGHWVTGRLLSARWDGVQEIEGRTSAISKGSMYTLRRIDGSLYDELPGDAR